MMKLFRYMSLLLAISLLLTLPGSAFALETDRDEVEKQRILAKADYLLSIEKNGELPKDLSLEQTYNELMEVDPGLAEKVFSHLESLAYPAVAPGSYDEKLFLDSLASDQEDGEVLVWSLPRKDTFFGFGEFLSGNHPYLTPSHGDDQSEPHVILGEKRYTEEDIVYTDEDWTIFSDGARIDVHSGKAYSMQVPVTVDESRVVEYSDEVMKLSNGIIIERPFEAYTIVYAHNFQEILDREEFSYLLDYPEDLLEIYRENGHPYTPETSHTPET